MELLEFSAWFASYRGFKFSKMATSFFRTDQRDLCHSMELEKSCKAVEYDNV